MKTVLRLEELAQFMLSIVLFAQLPFAWWWFPALILLPDISMLGYLINPQIGAYGYNLGHHKGLALAIGIVGLLLHAPVVMLVGVILFGHASMDRMMGYGLKYSDSFKHTHLGAMATNQPRYYHEHSAKGTYPGATGSIGYAVTQNLLARQWAVTILVRNQAKALTLFADAPSLIILEGNVQDGEVLNRAAAGADFIVHAINYPYHQWVRNMASATQHVIEAANQTGATIVFPGNIYGFGNTKEPIREDSRPNPNTRKGQLRLDLEMMLETAAATGPCRVINVRLPDFWGPNVVHEGIAPVFEGALLGKAMPWLMNADIPHQSVYTPDAAEIIARLMEHSIAQPAAGNAYAVWNYGGVTVPGIRAWFGQIAALTGKPANVQVMGRWLIRLAGLFKPVVREVGEMLYLYDNTILLDDTKVRSLFPDFQETPMTDALTTTLDWFATQRLQMPFVRAGDPAIKRPSVPASPTEPASRAETPPVSRPSIF